MDHALRVAAFTAFVALAGGYPLVRVLRRLRIGKQIREEGPDTHLEKKGTPTLGGVLVWASVLVSTAAFNVLGSESIVVPLLATGATGILGTADDLLGLLGNAGNGLTARMKFAGLTVIGLAVALATVALMTGQLLLLPIIGFVFVAEALSVILQVGYFRLTGGRRLFLMSPLHHHFEMLGWSETHVSQRFWLVSMLTGMVGIALALI